MFYYEQDDECDCIEFERKEYEMYYNNICTKTIYSTTKLEKTHEGSDEAYGYEEMYEIDNELGDANSVIESEGCDLEYDEGNTWDYFHERDDEIIGLETDKWVNSEIPNLLEKINNKSAIHAPLYLYVNNNKGFIKKYKYIVDFIDDNLKNYINLKKESNKKDGKE